MTFELVARTVLIEGVPDDATAPVTPYGRTGCCLLPDGTYLVGVFNDSQVVGNDTWTVWKVGTDGVVLGSLTVDSGGDYDGRIHLIELDGFLVQVLYMTSTNGGGKSYVIDASADDPVLLEEWDDPSGVNGYAAPVHHLYLRSIGVVAVSHRNGTSLYRRGRFLISRTGPDAYGDGYGIFPHPTNERKFAIWYRSGAAEYEYVAWEFTVTDSDGLTLAPLGPTVPSATVNYFVGGGNPYAPIPVILQEMGDNSLQVTTAADPATPLGGLPASTVTGINADPISTQIGDSLEAFAFAHEAWHDNGPVGAPTGPAFTLRCGIVRGITMESIDLEYGATSPDGYPNDENYVSLNTGSMAMHHRNGEIVISTCIVQQESLTNYYAVVAWKITGGDLTPLSGLDGAWRQGIDNASGRNALLSTDGWLQEAGEVAGLDAPAQPVWVKGSDRWLLLGRFADGLLPALPDPDPPETVDVVYHLTDINADLAAAATMAGATYSASGKSWGAFVAQASPPAAGDLVDASDGTFTTLVQPNGAGQDIEVFTARLTPVATPPAGAEPIAAAFTVRGRALSGDAASYLDGLITTPASQMSIRGKVGIYSAQLPFNVGPAWSLSSHGIYGRWPSDPEHPGKFRGSGYTVGDSVATALSKSDEGAAAWWVDKIEGGGFYIVVQSATTNLAHGNVDIAEMYLTIRYLVV